MARGPGRVGGRSNTSVGGSGAGRQNQIQRRPTASRPSLPGMLQVDEQQMPDVQSEVELSCSEEEEARSQPASRNSGVVVVEGIPGQPGKFANLFTSSVRVC